jgi:GxxExxY protein
MAELVHAQTTSAILGAFYTVYGALGYGFVESVYACAMVIELERRGLGARREVELKVFYRGVAVGLFRVDLLVEESVVVELKAADRLTPASERQLHNYLKAGEFDVGLVLNFGLRPEMRRLVGRGVRMRVDRMGHEELLQHDTDDTDTAG